MKKIVICFICLLILILGYVCYKELLLSNYRVNIKDELKAKLRNSTETITIKLNEFAVDDDYVEFNDIIYKKIGGEFVYSEEKSMINSVFSSYAYCLTNQNTNELEAVFKVGKMDNIYELVTAEDTTTSNLKNIDKKSLLKKYNINNDYDVYKYIIDNYDRNPNIFSSPDQIELNYIIKTFANTAIPAANITFINGDLMGLIYTVNNNSAYEVRLTHGKENYIFSFFNQNNSNYFNLDYVKEFINNVNFKD